MSAGIRLELAGPDGAAPHLAAWHALAEEAEDPNVFLSPWMLLPAARAFGAGRNLLLLFFYAPHPTHKARPPVLVGFCAVEERRSRLLPVPISSSFHHPAIHLGSPLCRAGFARAVVDKLLDFLRDGRRVVTLREIRADGPVHEALLDGLNTRRWAHVGLRRSTRALLLPDQSAELYLGRALASKRRKELRRQRDRLHEQGGLRVVHLGVHEDPRPWLEEFMRLEAAGWKGHAEQGEALAATPQTQAFFLEAITDGHALGRVQLMALRLADRTIAMKCNLLAGQSGFAFKITFDEAWARYSPGVQLELENIRQAHDGQLRWMDSCAHHSRFMINHLWTARRPVEDPVFSNGHPSTALLVTLLPALGWAREQWNGRWNGHWDGAASMVAAPGGQP